jgi:DNA-binding LacI/PurR family transcriptional regulator
VPRDISVIGCGDTEMGQYVDPPLTTVRMPFAEMGGAAARNLLALIAGQQPLMRVVLPHQLIVRHSVGAPLRAQDAEWSDERSPDASPVR